MSSPAQLELPRVSLKPSAIRVLEMLRQAGPRGVGGVEFVAAYIFAYSQRVGELRRAGYPIDSERDSNSKTYRYWFAHIDETRTEENA